MEKHYKVTEEKFNALLKAQGGHCAICLKVEEYTKNWHIDHDHSCCPSNKTCGLCVRGILCSFCNKALGMFKDDIDALESAVTYLYAHKAFRIAVNNLSEIDGEK